LAKNQARKLFAWVKNIGGTLANIARAGRRIGNGAPRQARVLLALTIWQRRKICARVIVTAIAALTGSAIAARSRRLLASDGIGVDMAGALRNLLIDRIIAEGNAAAAGRLGRTGTSETIGTNVIFNKATYTIITTVVGRVTNFRNRTLRAVRTSKNTAN